MSDVVWQAVLDDIYTCTVTRIDEYTGTLKVTNAQNHFVILEEKVNLSYAARFGPDVDDVALWQDLSCRAIDEQ